MTDKSYTVALEPDPSNLSKLLAIGVDHIINNHRKKGRDTHLCSFCDALLDATKGVTTEHKPDCVVLTAIRLKKGMSDAHSVEGT